MEEGDPPCLAQSRSHYPFLRRLPEPIYCKSWTTENNLSVGYCSESSLGHVSPLRPPFKYFPFVCLLHTSKRQPQLLNVLFGLEWVLAQSDSSLSICQAGACALTAGQSDRRRSVTHACCLIETLGSWMVIHVFGNMGVSFSEGTHKMVVFLLVHPLKPPDREPPQPKVNLCMDVTPEFLTHPQVWL